MQHFGVPADLVSLALQLFANAFDFSLRVRPPELVGAVGHRPLAGDVLTCLNRGLTAGVGQAEFLRCLLSLPLAIVVCGVVNPGVDCPLTKTHRWEVRPLCVHDFHVLAYRSFDTVSFFLRDFSTELIILEGFRVFAAGKQFTYVDLSGVVIQGYTKRLEVTVHLLQCKIVTNLFVVFTQLGVGFPDLWVESIKPLR